MYFNYKVIKSTLILTDVPYQIKSFSSHFPTKISVLITFQNFISGSKFSQKFFTLYFLLLMRQLKFENDHINPLRVAIWAPCSKVYIEPCMYILKFQPCLSFYLNSDKTCAELIKMLVSLYWYIHCFFQS